MIISIDKNNGLLMQIERDYDDEKKTINSLKQNAINLGYKESEIEVKSCTEKEYQFLLEAEKPVPTYEDLRQAEYPLINDLTVALWEKIIENRPKAADILQVQREMIKLKYPKT